MEINKDNLEKALDVPVVSNILAPKGVPPSTENKGLSEGGKEEVGFHKGSLNTLVNERNELFKMLQMVESIMQAHIKRLEELGVKIDTGNPKQ